MPVKIINYRGRFIYRHTKNGGRLGFYTIGKGAKKFDSLTAARKAIDHNIMLGALDPSRKRALARKRRKT